MENVTVVSPLIMGQHFSNESYEDPSILNDNDAAFHSAGLKSNGGERISKFLDSIGPLESKCGRFQLGYTLIVPLMRYFNKVNGDWHLNTDALFNTLDTIKSVERPVVVYLSANHFTDANNVMIDELCADPTNVMWDRNGPMEPDDYFGHKVVAWTLSNYDAKITKFRSEAFRASVRHLMSLPEKAKKRITAISMLGEVHDMIPDFIKGPGRHVPLHTTTDYSPTSKHGFRSWLADKFGTVDKFRQTTGLVVSSFNEVEPPAGLTDRPSDRVDLSSSGTLTIYGWLHDAKSRDFVIDVLLNGNVVGEALYGLSRTDVVDDVPEITNPNIGYEFKLDFRSLRDGEHVIDLVVRTHDQSPLHMGRRTVSIGGNVAANTALVHDIASIYTAVGHDPALSGAIDGPRNNSEHTYNPLSDLWLQYRNLVVRNYLDHFANIALEEGAAKSLLFSHQMAAKLYGTWESDLIATDLMQQNPANYNHGVTLYGGTSFGDPLKKMIKNLGWSRFGVNELHPGVPLDAETYQKIFEDCHKNGAVFMSPYYMSIVPPRLLSGSKLDRFLINEKNEQCGSSLYWKAIVNLMNKAPKKAKSR